MYRHCAFLGDEKIGFGGFCFRTCTNPRCVSRACIPSCLSDTEYRCRLFRAKSVMNSFDTEKKNGGGRVL